MADVRKSLTKVRLVEDGTFSDLECPCMYYSDPSFFGYKLDIKVDSRNRWYYISRGLFWDKEGGPYLSEDGAVRAACERWYKTKAKK
jgi:hypothetical protein